MDVWVKDTADNYAPPYNEWQRRGIPFDVNGVDPSSHAQLEHHKKHHKKHHHNNEDVAERGLDAWQHGFATGDASPPVPPINEQARQEYSYEDNGSSPMSHA